ncbi:MAG TPA: hypothetical protein VML19_14390 [Verrucomicrobiae bacterium]|nr:hypothetical protein [Verrucomicrobiae bacterium]
MAGNALRRFLGAYAVCVACVHGQALQGIMHAPVREFVRTGQTGDVLRDLVRSERQHGVFAGVVGLENLGDTWQRVSVNERDTDLGTVLRDICAQDRAYQIVLSDRPELINLLATVSDVPGHEVLAFQIPALDIEADIWPENLITRLSDYSPPLAAYLLALYLKLGGGSTGQPGTIGGFSETAKLPHFSIHLKNVSVREALNAISLESFRMYRAIGIDPRIVHTPDQLLVSPTGWEYRLVDPRGTSFYRWSHEIFKAL